MWPPAPHRRWIAVNALIAAAIVNAVLNAAIARLSVGGERHVPLWSLHRTSLLGDTLITLFVLPLLTTVLGTWAVRRARRSGRLERLGELGRRAPALAALPAPLAGRALLVGAATFALLAAPVSALLAAFADDGLGVSAFVGYKAGFAVALGA